MTQLLETAEGEPESRPSLVDRVTSYRGSAPEDIPIMEAAVWRRIEAFIGRRWTPRPITFTVEGPGPWIPPVAPFAIDTAERWDAASRMWIVATAEPAPLGFDLSADVWRLSGTAGDGAFMPAEVAEAAMRLFEYSRGIAENHWHEGALVEGVAYKWTARALELSGAADLLRPYRRLGARAA